MIAFGIAGARVLPDASIYYPEQRRFCEQIGIARFDDGRPQTWIIAVAHCSCGRRLEFPVPSGYRISMPYEVQGWRFGWATVGERIDVLCETCREAGVSHD